MPRIAISGLVGLLATAGMGSCAPAAYDPAVLPEKAEYLPTEIVVMDAGLIQIIAQMRGARAPQHVADYADCTIAAYALSQDQGYARHLRTNIDEDTGIWRADAVYTISPVLPRGMRVIDADVTKENCTVAGIPTV